LNTSIQKAFRRQPPVIRFRDVQTTWLFRLWMASPQTREFHIRHAVQVIRIRERLSQKEPVQ
jgi:hypothetical protein